MGGPLLDRADGVLINDGSSNGNEVPVRVLFFYYYGVRLNDVTLG